MGRPRATPQTDETLEPRETILAAAARLFTSQGYAAASTRQIAADSGLRQASLFHYFEKKDDILGVLLDRTLEPSLEFADRLAAADPAPDAGLYLLVLRDVRNACTGPGAVGYLPDAKKPQFASFWVKRDRLIKTYETIIDTGRKTGVFDVQDVELAAFVVFGLIEGTALWFSEELPQAPAEIWRAVADRALRSLLVAPDSLEQVRREAARVERQLEAHPSPQ